MKLGVIRRILKEELKGGSVPGWIDGLLSVLNQFIDSVTTALRNNLNFEDNFSCKVFDIELTHDVFQVINPMTRLKVVGILVVNAEGQFIDTYGFQRNTDGSVSVKVKFVSGSGKTVCRVILLLG